MRLHEHVILGGAAAAALHPILGPNALVFFGASVLLDVDHYWHYAESTGWRDFNVRRFFLFHQEAFRMIHRPDFLAMNTLHTAEFFLTVYLAARELACPVLMVAFWGGLFHLLLDVLNLAWYGATFARVFSIAEYVIRRRRMEARGLDPFRPFREAVARVMAREGVAWDPPEEREAAAG
jgi:hypothetical protein